MELLLADYILIFYGLGLCPSQRPTDWRHLPKKKKRKKETHALFAFPLHTNEGECFLCSNRHENVQEMFINMNYHELPMNYIINYCC